MQEWDSFTEERKLAYSKQKEPEHAGVEASLELLEWLWDSGVSAVVGDAISWEVSSSKSRVRFMEMLMVLNCRFILRQERFLCMSTCLLGGECLLVSDSSMFACLGWRTNN